MTEVHDVVIVGAGTAGLAALREVRKRTERFLIVNDGPYGTTCARVGCMPSKALLEAAHALARRRSFEAFGIRGGEGLSADLPAVLRRVRALRDDFVAGALAATEDLGERSLAGRARLLGPDRLEVAGRELRARRIVLATGSRPVVPQAWRELGDRVLTTDTLFEQEDLPSRIAVIGLGALGVEVAQALGMLGLEVFGFGSSPRLAGLIDEEVDAVLATAMGRDVVLRTGLRAEVAAAGAGLEVVAGAERVRVDRVIAAMGRRPNVDGLGLERLGVDLDEHGLPPVDPTTLQVADLPVFLAGDANGSAAILHEAADEGHIAGINACAPEVRCFRRRPPLAIVFSEPSVAVVGARLDELDPEQVVVGRFDYARQGRARTAERHEGRLAIHADRRSGRLLGAELCAPAGEHMAHFLALALERELDVHDLLRAPYYHPVLEEGLRTALRRVAAGLPPRGDSDLAVCEDFGVDALD